MEHTFKPDTYYNTLGSHEPVLRVQSGDTIATTTLCAAGFDANGERVASGGNPQTGPFYIEGAEAGDSIAVRLDKIVPNRSHGWSSPRLASGVLDPGAANDLGKHERLSFRIDHENA